MKKLPVVLSLAIIVLVLAGLAGCSNAATTEQSNETARPSNPGGPGEAINLTGDAAQGAQIFMDNCVVCHGDQGVGGVTNMGSADGTVPSLNPIDASMVSSDYKTFATNIDLFVEHGSTPEADKPGDTPTLSMLPFGDQKTLTAQQIADVIAYVISLNQK